MKELAKLKELHSYSLGRFQELESAFDDENYDEEYTDTLIRKYEEGYSDALAMVIEALEKSICVTCNEVKDIEMHGHCGACYYGWTTKKESAI